MLTHERTLMDIENEMNKRVESALKDQLPIPPDERKGVGGKEDDPVGKRSTGPCPKQQLGTLQMNQYPPAKALRQTAPTVGGGSLNFSTSSEEFDLSFTKKPKTIRDPMSHRIIEKRRRDRMNNCLADLSHLIPTNYLKQGQGRIEKTEIIEMAIKHIKNLTNTVNQPTVLKSSLPDRYLGFKECQDEVMRYLVEVEGWDAMDKLCTRLMAHLEQAGEKFRIMNDESLSKVAKEEQYRHADEEMGSIHTHKKPYLMEPVAPPTIYPPAQLPPFHPPVEHRSLMGTTPPMPQENSPMETQTIYPNFNNFATAQQITQEHLKRDKHLWTLLQTQYNASSMDDSGVSTDPGSSSSNVTEGDKFSEQTAVTNSKAPSETSSANSSTCGTADSCSEKNGSSVYKFKHNITQRFSLEEKKVGPSDTSSSSSNEEKRAEKGKRKFRHVRLRSPTSSHFRNSESLTVPNATNEDLGSGSSDSTEDVKMSNYLPAFVLHPNGTHYIPLSFHPSSISSNVFSKNGHAQSIYHPISIPVNFGGPLLYMKKFNIHSDSSTSYGGSTTTDSPSGCSAENSSTCNSENSPSPEQFAYKSQT